MHRLRMLVLSLTACFAFGAALSAAAWASGPPENTAPPTVTGKSPHVWGSVASTLGTWTNGPEHWAYQWERCNASGGECKEIAGATHREYAILPPDHGHTLVFRVTASNTAGQGTASSAPSAVITPVTGAEFVSSEHVYPVYFAFESGPAVFEDAGGWTLQCNGMSGSGNFTSPTEISGASMTLTGCRGGTAECKAFETSPLHGFLGYLSATSKTVGLVLEGESSPFATFRCNGSLAHLQGRLIGQISPVNVSTNGFTLAYTLQRGGVQKPNAFENGPTEQLEWIWNAGLEKWGLGASNYLGTSRKGEIVA